MKYAIFSVSEELVGGAGWWSNDVGFGDRLTATLFTKEERESCDATLLAIDAVWIEVPEPAKNLAGASIKVWPDGDVHSEAQPDKSDDYFEISLPMSTKSIALTVFNHFGNTDQARWVFTEVRVLVKEMGYESDYSV